MNSVIAHGALAVEEINGERYFVAVNTYPRATCDPPEVRESVLTIAATPIVWSSNSMAKIVSKELRRIKFPFSNRGGWG